MGWEPNHLSLLRSYHLILIFIVGVGGDFHERPPLNGFPFIPLFATSVPHRKIPISWKVFTECRLILYQSIAY
jgi:hypothetical protein